MYSTEGRSRNDNDYQEENRPCYSINKYMISAKLTYFANNARYAITDYLLLFYTSTGLSPSQAGMINGLQYIGGMIANPLWGFLADKKGYRRLVIIFLSLMGILCYSVQPFLAYSYAHPNNNVCPIVNQTISYATKTNQQSNNRLYYSLMIAAIFSASFDGSIMSFIDAGVLRRVQKSPIQSDVGKQRYAGSVGMSLGSIAYSLSLAFFPRAQVSCFVGLFITYAIFSICTIITSFFLFRGLFTEKEKEQKRENVTSVLTGHLKKIETLYFLLNVLFNGFIQALKFSFLFLFLKELNAPTLLFGFSISINSVSAVTVYVLSSHLIKLLGGPANAMCFSTFAWSIRFLCTAFLVNPFYIFAIDMFHGFTYSLFRVASLEYVKETTDAKIFTSMCGIVNSLYLCLSFLIANVAGGRLYEAFGARKMFLGASIGCIIWTILNVTVLCLKRSRKKDYEKL